MDYIKTSEIKTLVSLQRTDYQISLYNLELSQIPGKAKLEEEKYAKEKSTWQDCFDALKTLQLRQREAELKAAEMQTAIEKYQMQSHSLKDNASYAAMMSQIEYAKQKKDEAETNALILLDEIEDAKAKENVARENMYACEKARDSALLNLEERKRQLEQFIQAEQQKRSSLTEQIMDKNILGSYENLRKKKRRVINVIKGIPVGTLPVCPACNMRLTQHFAGLLRIPDLFVICPECSAWLCLENDSAA